MSSILARCAVRRWCQPKQAHTHWHSTGRGAKSIRSCRNRIVPRYLSIRLDEAAPCQCPLPSSVSTKRAISLPRQNGWPVSLAASDSHFVLTARRPRLPRLVPAMALRFFRDTSWPDLVEVSLGERLPQREVWLLVRRDLDHQTRACQGRSGYLQFRAHGRVINSAQHCQDNQQTPWQHGIAPTSALAPSTGGRRPRCRPVRCTIVLH